jgi:hypothetical protein
MRRQWILFVLILLVFYGNAYCEDIAYTVTQDLRLRRNDSGRTAGGVTVTEGEIVFFQGRINSDITSDGFVDIILVRTEHGREGWIDASHISLQGSLPLPDSIASKRWIYSYYQHIILEQKKEILFIYEPFWRDEYYDYDENEIYYIIFGEYPPWQNYFFPTNFVMENNLVKIRDIYISDFIDFVIVRHRQEADAITFDVICVYMSNHFPQNYLSQRFNEGETYRLIFKIDGDYMDVFVNDETNKIATLVGVDDYFVEAVHGIFQGEMVDLSRIFWPRRADGSMDYQPPAGVLVASNVVEETKQLKAIEPSVDVVDPSVVTENQLSDQNSPEAGSIPLWAWFAVSGGAVVVIGGAVLFVLKRKKS